MTIDEDAALEELVSKGVRIPPQPKVLLDLQDALRDDDYDSRSLAKIISRDPGIVAMLFKASRSPVFARGKTLDSIEKILMTIGVKQTCNLVQAMALSTSMAGGDKKKLEMFWARSQDIAQLAALVARDRVSVCNVFPDQAYMAGIFHECGVPVLMQRFPNYAEKLDLSTACCWPDLFAEDERLGVDHCAVGYLVARHWKLPEFVCAAVRYHSELPTDESGTSRALVTLLQLAIHFYHRLARVDDPLWQKMGDQVMTEVGIPTDDEDDFFERIADQFVGG